MRGTPADAAWGSRQVLPCHVCMPRARRVRVYSATRSAESVFGTLESLSGRGRASSASQSDMKDSSRSPGGPQDLVSCGPFLTLRVIDGNEPSSNTKGETARDPCGSHGAEAQVNVHRGHVRAGETPPAKLNTSTRKGRKKPVLPGRACTSSQRTRIIKPAGKQFCGHSALPIFLVSFVIEKRPRPYNGKAHLCRLLRRCS